MIDFITTCLYESCCAVAAALFNAYTILLYHTITI